MTTTANNTTNNTNNVTANLAAQIKTLWTAIVAILESYYSYRLDIDSSSNPSMWKVVQGTNGTLGAIYTCFDTGYPVDDNGIEVQICISLDPSDSRVFYRSRYTYLGLPEEDVWPAWELYNEEPTQDDTQQDDMQEQQSATMFNDYIFSIVGSKNGSRTTTWDKTYNGLSQEQAELELLNCYRTAVNKGFEVNAVLCWVIGKPCIYWFTSDGVAVKKAFSVTPIREKLKAAGINVAEKATEKAKAVAEALTAEKEILKVANTEAKSTDKYLEFSDKMDDDKIAIKENAKNATYHAVEMTKAVGRTAKSCGLLGVHAALRSLEYTIAIKRIESNLRKASK